MKIKETIDRIEQELLSQRNGDGVWDGYLSSSALAVAVSVFSLWKVNTTKNNNLINKGLNWLKGNINHDGGYGDTPVSKSNLSTSLLCWSAFSIVTNNSDFSDCITKLEEYLKNEIGSLQPKAISTKVLNHYADDKTFSVPILAMCAIAGRLGENGWQFVPQLPHQLAILPHTLFRLLNLNVVSYALPALISMGLAKLKQTPSKNPVLKLINKQIEPKLIKILADKQPPNGGFLEAIPLTAFVLMTMVESGYKDNIICQKAENFIQQSIRIDGSWPIDTSLTTWVTTLGINAFSDKGLNTLDKEQIIQWLLNQQQKTIHPFTKTAPGGWAWINTQGGVADGDDTSGAIIALKRLDGNSAHTKQAAQLGLNWLLGIQNNDGGFPTFCKGWGKLPFDASCPDITAHAIRAILSWQREFNKSFNKKLQHSLNKSIKYLKNTQNTDGSWLPLWFGNEYDSKHTNPVYGTSLVISGLVQAKKAGVENLSTMIEKGTGFLISCKKEDGSWGGNKNLKASIEETSLVITALNSCGKQNELDKSINWLISELNKDEIKASPIGLYFASLWYYEKLYPITFALKALNALENHDIT